jgi:type 1 glutamine amidotransferase
MKLPAFFSDPMRLILILLCVLLTGGAPPAPSRPRVLVFSKTNHVRHANIPAGIAAIKRLGAENGFDTDDTEDSTWFTPGGLQKYAALVFLNPSGKVFGPDEEKALQDYIRHGGGLAGMHAAATCEYNWPWYGQMLGAYFKSAAYPPQHAKLHVVDKQHPSTKFLPDSLERFDEWYNFREIRQDLTILVKIDERSYKGGENGDDHPVAWYHSFEGGRVFYTAMGDSDACFSDEVFEKHILGGILYAIGKTK